MIYKTSFKLHLTRIAALEGNLQEECQARQQAEANAAQQLQQNIQAQITG